MRRWADPPAPHRNPLQARTPAPATEVNPSAATGHAGGYFSPLYFFLLSFLFLSPAFIRIATRQYYFLCYLLSLCSSPSSCSEDRKPLYRTDPATSTSFNTSSSRYTSLAPILLPSPLLILFNHRRCVSSQHNSAPSRVGIPLHPSFLLFSFLNLFVDTVL